MDAEQAAGSPGQGTWGLRLPGHGWSWWGKPWEHKGPSPKGAQAGSLHLRVCPAGGAEGPSVRQRGGPVTTVIWSACFLSAPLRLPETYVMTPTSAFCTIYRKHPGTSHECRRSPP